MLNSESWYKNNDTDIIWWLDQPDVIGEFVFSFDRKKRFNLFSDYPHELTREQKKAFDMENPFWANFFSDRR